MLGVSQIWDNQSPRREVAAMEVQPSIFLHCRIKGLSTESLHPGRCPYAISSSKWDEHPGILSLLDLANHEFVKILLVVLEFLRCARFEAVVRRLGDWRCL